MPRHIIRADERVSHHPKLARTLAKEIREPGGDPQPFILEEEIQPNGSRHVQVIWELWKKVPEEDRGQVILDAYALAEGAAFADNIAIAAGYTPHEALALGLLPWVVTPARQGGLRMGLSATDADVERAIRDESIHTILGPKLTSAHGLRYPVKEDAIAARKRLQQSLIPSPSDWVIREDLPIDEP